jgi:hypothetical protein
MGFFIPTNMKTAIIVILAIAAIFIFVQAYVAKTTSDTEQQEYEVIERDGVFEIRYYPSAIMASVSVDGNYSSSSGAGFRILAGYIFGSNSEGLKIPMTAPVHMQQDSSGYFMSFVMPSAYTMDKLPVPDNGQVRLHESVPAYVASIRFDGFASDDKIEKHRESLRNYLLGRGIAFEEPFTFLGYNPPYQMVNRRNEVMVKIDY